MQRRLLYPLLVLLVAVALFILGGRNKERGRGSAADHALPTAAGGAPSAEDGARPWPAAAGGVAEARQLLDDPAPPGGHAGLLRLRAVRKEDGQPLPGTEFFVLEGEAVAADDLSALYATSPGIEELFASLGRRAVAGADGSVLVPRPAGESALIARAPGRFGVATLPAGGPAERVVELEGSATLKLRVTDADGAPAAGVPLGLRPALAGIWLRQARSGADGRADFQHVRALLPALPDQRLVVGARLLLAEPAEVEVLLDSIPAEPVHLVLPHTGSVEVQVRGSSGAPPAGLESVVLGRALPDPSLAPPPDPLRRAASPRVEATVGVDGRARFARVGLGLRLVARAVFADGGETSSEPFLGPTRAGQRVEWWIDADLGAVVLAGRLLRADGSPVTAAPVDAVLETPSLGAPSGRAQRLTTDAEGRFRSTWPLEPGAAPPDRLTLSLRNAGEAAPHAMARVTLPPALAAGEHHLGDILLEELPLLVAGRLIGPGDAGIPGAMLLVEERLVIAHAGGASSIWQTNFDWMARTDADGAFLLRGSAPLTPVRLAFRSAGYLPLERPFQPGESGLLLRAERGASLHGSVLLDESVPAGEVSVSALRSDAEAAQPRSARVADDGAFSWHDLAPGVYGLRIATGGSRGAVLFEVDGVLLAAGQENRDPRLQGIDLRERLRYFVIGLRDQDGAPVPSAVLREYGGRPEDGFYSAMRGLAPILTARWPLDLVVEAQGFRPELLNDVSEDRQVVLRRGLEVALVLEELPALAAGERLGVSLVPAEDDGFSAAGQGGFDGDGRCDLVLPGPGRYFALPTLWWSEGRTRARKHTLGDRETAALIEVREAAGVQVFTLRIDAAALARARAELGKG